MPPRLVRRSTEAPAHNHKGAARAPSRALWALAALGLSCHGAGPTDGTAIAPGQTVAQAVCPPANVDATRYLRQLSLDLRGTPPSDAELAQVAHEGTVPTAMIDTMLRSPEFLAQSREWHRAQLWPNLDGFGLSASPIGAWDFDPATGNRMGNIYSPDPELVDNAAHHANAVVAMLWNGTGDRPLRGNSVGTVGCDPTLRYPAPAPSGATQPTYTVNGAAHPYYDRDGVPMPYHDAVHCPNYCSNLDDAGRAAATAARTLVLANFSAMSQMGAWPAGNRHELDPAGMSCPSGFPNRVVNPCDNVPDTGPDQTFRVRREGARMATHYWAPGPLLTCAYDAQDRANSTQTGDVCTHGPQQDPSCGCGVGGVACMPGISGIPNATASRAQFRLRSALQEEPVQIINSVIDRDEDYFDVFRTQRSFAEGALSFAYRNQTAAVAGLELAPPASMSVMPDVPYADEGWHEYVRDPQHSGILTTAAYLGRFPTWRSRVSQFRNAFLCRPFTPATAAVPSPDDACTREPNLARRCGCQNCHSAIEPMTAWFGRWAERSTRYLDTVNYPSFDPNCQACALRGAFCTTRCRTQYVIDTVDADGSRYAGTLRTYLYRAPDEVTRIDEGPSGMVAASVASGELQSCTVRHAWQTLLGRAMSDDEQNTMLTDLVGAFDASNHNFRALIRAIVLSAPYRRVD